MPEYAKIADIGIIADAVGLPFPSPLGAFFEQSSAEAITAAAFPIDQTELYFYGAIPGADWGEATISGLAFQLYQFADTRAFQYGANWLAMTSDVLNNISDPADYGFSFIEFEKALDGTSEIVVPISALQSTYQMASSPYSDGGLGLIPGLVGSDLCAFSALSYPTAPFDDGIHVCACVYEAGVPTMYNVATYVSASSVFQYAFCNFGDAPPYRLFTINVAGAAHPNAIYSLDWEPETFGGDNFSGTYTNSVPDLVSYDDPIVQNIVETINPEYYMSSVLFPGENTALVGYPIDTDAHVFIQYFPLSETYSVLTVGGLNTAINDLYGAGYSSVTVVFDPASLSMTAYGFGGPPEPEPVFVPQWVPVKLPCFVNCIPLIDRRK